MPCFGWYLMHSYYDYHLRLAHHLCVCRPQLAIVFLQALPLCKLEPTAPGAASEQTIIWRDGDEVCLRLAKRKNKPKGSGTMRRRCTCAGGSSTCVVHMLWDQYIDKLDMGAKPWHRHVTANMARDRLRQTLRRLHVEDANRYGTQDLRRGHAEVPSCRPDTCLFKHCCVC